VPQPESFTGRGCGALPSSLDEILEQQVPTNRPALAAYWQLSHCSSSIGSTGTKYSSTSSSGFLFMMIALGLWPVG